MCIQARNDGCMSFLVLYWCSTQHGGDLVPNAFLRKQGPSLKAIDGIFHKTSASTAGPRSGPTGKVPCWFPSLISELPRRFLLCPLSFTTQAPRTTGRCSEHRGEKWSRYQQRRGWEREGRRLDELVGKTSSVKRGTLWECWELHTEASHSDTHRVFA